MDSGEEMVQGLLGGSGTHRCTGKMQSRFTDLSMVKEINHDFGNRLARGTKSSSVQEENHRQFVVYAWATSGTSILQEKILLTYPLPDTCNVIALRVGQRWKYTEFKHRDNARQ